MAEPEGFEPSIGCPIHAFQACAIDHSATAPRAVSSAVPPRDMKQLSQVGDSFWVREDIRLRLTAPAHSPTRPPNESISSVSYTHLTLPTTPYV